MSCRKEPSPPNAGPGAATPAASPTQHCQSCNITSQTIATSPANRARTKIGVGEEVDLTVSPGPATWTITSGSGTITPSSGSNSTVRYTASDTTGSVTITATGQGCSCTITLTVVPPSHWTMQKQPGTNLKHETGRPDCGWKGVMYVHPNDVNFYRVETREMDSKSVATGSYNPNLHDKWHGNYPPPDRASEWFLIRRHSEADGSTDDVPDEIYSGDPGRAARGAAPPFTAGSMYFPITIQWRVLGGATNHDFPVVRQEHQIFPDGKCESRKGGYNEHCMYNDATSTY